MTAAVDRNGNTTSYAYDPGGLLTTVTDPVGLVATLAYTGGLLASVTDPASRVTGFAHDASGNLTRITDPDSSARLFAYDARHRLTAQTSKRGFVTSYDYGPHGRLVQSNLPDGSTRQLAAAQVVGVIDVSAGQGSAANPAPFTRPEDVTASFTDGNGHTSTTELDRFGAGTRNEDALARVTTATRNDDSKPIRSVAANGRVTEMTYDERGNLLTLTEAVGDALERTTTFEYEPVFNRVTKITNPALNETTFAYDASGNLLSVTDALTNTTSLTYDARGLVLTGTDRNGEVATFTYDANGNLDTITDAELNVTDFTRDLAGNATQIVQGLGTPEVRTTAATYDARNRFLTATDGAGGTAEIRYDAAGNITELEDATGRIEFRAYDTRNRVVQVDNPVTGITATAYDGNGNATTVTDALPNVTTIEFDAGNRATKQIDALLDERIFGYDDEDNLTSVTDARGNATTFAYDLLNRVTSRTNPLSEVASFTYDSRGNLVTATDPKSQVTTNTYDDLSRLTQVSTIDNLIALGFDPEGNVITLADDDSELSFTHDGLNRILTAATDPGGVQPLVMLTNAYDAVGDRISLTDDAGLAGAVTGYAFDGAGRLNLLTTPAGQPVGLGYDPAGRVTGMTFPNTVSTAVTYELATGRLSQLTHTAGVTPLADFVYGYNGLGSITSVTELAQTRNFAYDDLQRLTAGGTLGSPESYAYDAEGNRTTSHLSAAHTTDIANRLTEDDDFTYTYDLNGNLTSKTANVGGAVTDYTYDAQDQLIRIDFPDLTAAEYRYDGLGRRIEKDVDGIITRYIYDGSDILLEFDGAGNLLARYSHGQQIDQPLAVERGGQSYYYQADHQGSVRKITDGAGFVVSSYDYDSYGNIEASFEGIANPFTYTGRELDAESGLYYYRARYYDPATGRFINQDPIGFAAGDLNLYRYVFNDPVNFTDPDGRLVFLLPAIPAALTAFADAAAFVGSAYLAAILLNEIADDPDEKSDADADASGNSCPVESGGNPDDGSGDDGDGGPKSPKPIDLSKDPLEGTKNQTFDVRDEERRFADALEQGKSAQEGAPGPRTVGQKVMDIVRVALDILGQFRGF